MAIDILHSYENEPPPADFIMPGFESGTVGALVSPGGTGKSMLALQIAAAVAGADENADSTGLGIATNGPVLYLSAEDSAAAIWRRLYALGSRFNQTTREAHAERLLIETLVGQRPDIMQPEWQMTIIDAAVGRRLVILDTLTRFHTLDENSNSDMSRLVSTLEYVARLAGTTLLYLHHSSKAMAVAGRGDEQQASRGASALVDNVRWSAYLAGMSATEAKALGIEDEDRGYYCRFGVSKQNYGPPFGLHWMRRGKGGILEPVEMAKIEYAEKPKGGRRND
jgi:hypothetical protein